jgi:hypothetical protein
MLVDRKIFGVGSNDFRENLGRLKNRSLERKKFPVISSLEGRSAMFMDGPLNAVFGKKLRGVKKLLEGAKFSV